MQANKDLILICSMQIMGTVSLVTVALHLDNSTIKVYLCNQGGTVYLSCKNNLPHIESGQQE